MAERFRLPFRPRFRPTAAGIAFFILPLTLLYKGVTQTGTSSLIAGIGFPSLVILSLLFLLSGAYSIVRAARGAEDCVTALPETGEIRRRVKLVTNPGRPRFLPGIRLSVHWEMRFGPFTHHAAAPLPVTGAGSAMLVFPHRGEWLSRSFIRAGDPFGFFHLDCPCGTFRRVCVPPGFSTSEGADIPGSPAAETATAPRLREDAEERLERRSYIPGDDPRRLDWKVFARTGEMLVRVGEEGIPFKGRLWMRVISTSVNSFHEKRQIRRLDYVLEAAAALVRHLEEEGQDVRIILPGEEKWAGMDKLWDKRLARSLPSGSLSSIVQNYPSPGERLWIISHPGDDEGRTAAVEAMNRGCRVSLGYPACRVKLRRYRRMLVKAESSAEAEGLDVRRV